MSTSSIMIKKSIIEDIYFKDVRHEDYLLNVIYLSEGIYHLKYLIPLYITE